MMVVSIASLLAFVTMTVAHEWWKEAVVYQVYPASFKESRVQDAIGWGDINGITEGLEHIQELGADTIWLSPHYDSSMYDMGYDISDYESVNPLFGGSMRDIQRLIDQVHKRGMRILFDLVINHTSDQHEWFQASRQNKTNPYRDFYFWRPPQYVNGTRYPPNNWSGSINGSAWKYDEATDEYTLHLFGPHQVDLNWDNPKVREALFDEAMRFWLDKGIDGFRMDVFSDYSKVPGLPSVPANDTDFHDGSMYYSDGPNLNKYLKQMNSEVLTPYNAFTVGEYGTGYDMQQIQEYVGASRHEIDELFSGNIVYLGVDGNAPTPWNMSEMRQAVDFVQSIGSPKTGDGWTDIFLENHDRVRSITHFANDEPEYRVASGRMLSMMLTTLSGTFFLYQGEEIGLINVPSNWTIEDYRDYIALEYYQSFVDDGGNLTKAMADLQAIGRDNARYPFNWNRTGGFSANSTTWIPQAHLDINLADQINDADSVYEFWRHMLKMRKKEKELFVYGSFELIDHDSERFLAYQKVSKSGKVMVLLNFSEDECSPPVAIPDCANLVAQTHKDVGESFKAFEGRIYRMDR